jgi:hypothetical protein
MNVAILLLGLALQDKAEDITIWNMWADFEPGSSVTVETSWKIRITRTLVSKTADQLVLKSVLEVPGGKIQPVEQEEVITKTEPVSPYARKCPKCAVSHLTVTFSKDSLVFQGNTIECRLLETTQKDCSGVEKARTRSWMSREVPGWFLKEEISFGKDTMTSVCTGYGKKKK